ncbi:MAG TPA: hypothetical protein VGF98_14170 [Candidatus Tumulicola sp.]
MSIAEKIAGSLIKTYGGKVADSVGLGSVWKFFSGDSGSDHSEEILAKLDDISAQLQGISKQIARLQDDTKTAFKRASFDIVVQPLQALMDANDTLKDDYRRLFVALAGDNDRDVDKALDQIQKDLEMVSKGPETWHNHLIGTVGTSVIVAASGIASDNPEFYTQKSAQTFQDTWDLFDAQQAMTLFYYIEYLNATTERDSDRPEGNQPAAVLDTIRTYLHHRQQQLILLRGQKRNVTQVMTLSISGNPRMLHGSFSGPALPPDTIVALKPPYTMWSLQLTGPTAQGSSTYEIFCSSRQDVMRFQNPERDSVRAVFENTNQLQIDGLLFERPVGKQFEDLVTAAKGTNDGFYKTLGDLGFVFPAGAGSIWTLPTTDESDEYLRITPNSKFECLASSTTDDIRRSGIFFSGNNLYHENAPPETPCTDPNAWGLSIYYHATQGQYFYT